MRSAVANVTCSSQLRWVSMGPDFRRDDGFTANTVKTVIPVQTGTHAELQISHRTKTTVMHKLPFSNFPACGNVPLEVETASH